MKIDGFKLYGGATVTTIIDGSGAEWIACCATKLATGKFGFYLFRNRIEVPYEPFCTGRGSINGGGKWIAWTNLDFFTGDIPGFVPHTQPAGTPPNGILTIPPQGGIEGGEIILSGDDGHPDWHIDVYDGRLRFHVGGRVVAEWGEP